MRVFDVESINLMASLRIGCSYFFYIKFYGKDQAFEMRIDTFCPDELISDLIKNVRYMSKNYESFLSANIAFFSRELAELPK